MSASTTHTPRSSWFFSNFYIPSDSSCIELQDLFFPEFSSPTPHAVEILPDSHTFMSGSQEMPWPNNPNAPTIPYDVYFKEKASFAGLLISSILYGTCEMPLPKHLPVRVHFVRSVYSRDHHRVVLSMYGLAV